MNHTPGPWTFADGAPRTIKAPNRLGPLLADRKYYPCVPENKADWQLIAAAPDLLFALKMLLANIDDYQRINHLGGFDNHDQVLARAAIAKAEGQL